MSDTALNAGYTTFGNEFIRLLQEKEGPWRTAGRKTKAMPNGEDKDWWAENGLAMVKNYHDWRMNNPQLVIWDTPQGVPAIELAVNITLADGTLLRGYIDRVFQDFDSGELLIVDLKSGKNTPPPIQLAVYRLALEETFGFSPKFGSYWMAREGTLDTVHDLERFPPRMVARWFRDVNKAMQAGVYVPHVTRDCGYCGLRDQCYVWADDAHTPDFDSDINMTEGSN